MRQVSPFFFDTFPGGYGTLYTTDVLLQIIWTAEWGGMTTWHLDQSPLENLAVVTVGSAILFY